MTPNDIMMLLMCHTIGCNTGIDGAYRSPADDMAIKFLLSCDLIELKTSVYQTTDRGVAHIKQILNLALPKAAWINENGDVI